MLTRQEQGCDCGYSMAGYDDLFVIVSDKEQTAMP